MREVLPLLGIALAILLGGLLVYRWVFPEDAVLGLVVHHVEGEVHHVGEEGLKGAVVGDVVGVAQRIQVGEAGGVQLLFGENTRMRLEANSSLEVVGADAEGLEVELEEGRVHATVRPGSPAIGVVARDRSVRTRNGRFGIALDDRGATSVEVQEGTVALSGFGEVRALADGERVIVTEGGSPLQGEIPSSLVLNVDWPPAERTRASKAIVRGQTEPGAQISVTGGQSEVGTVADDQGEFALEVPLAEGLNALDLLARSVMGREEEGHFEVIKDSQAPTAEFEIRY